jgi:hypothetical protein
MNKQDLFELYLTDPQLINKWHIRAGEGIETCVSDTWDIIKDHELYLYNFGYFSIDRDGDIVPRLGGFFIKPEYRNAENKQLLYMEICSKMPGVFLSGLHNKNTRGIKFLSKLPGSEIVTITDNYTYFCFRQEKK